MECTYAPEGRSYGEYRRYLNELADRAVVHDDKVGTNVTIAVKISQQAREAYDTSKPDVAFYNAMKASNFLKSLAGHKDEVLRQYGYSTAERKHQMKSNLEIAERVSTSGGALENLHGRMIAYERQISGLREEILQKQSEKGELTEDERAASHAFATAEDSEKERELQAARLEALRKREASDKAVADRFFSSVIQMTPTPSPNASLPNGNDAKTARLFAQLGGAPIAALPASPSGGTDKQESLVAPPMARQEVPPPVKPAQTQIPERSTKLQAGVFLQFPQLRSQVPRFPVGQKANRAGLKNLGNTCFLNSVLQCLYSLSNFRSHIIGENYLPDLQPGRGRVINALSEAFGNMQSLVGTVNTSNLKYAVGERNETFSGFSQQDASEFFLSLINEAHADIDSKEHWYAGKAEGVPTHGLGPNGVQALKAAASYFALNSLNSIFQRTFMFQTRSITQCSRCMLQSEVVNSELSLELPFPPNCRTDEIVDIYSMLREYCKIETFEAMSPKDSNGYKCERCGVYVNAKRQTTILSAPQTLVLTLKRFKRTSDFSDKISSCVSFPEFLSLKPFCASRGGAEQADLPASSALMDVLSQSQQGKPSWDPPQLTPNAAYRLMGIVNHRGNIHGGHYTADVRDESSDCWFSISDERVTGCEKPDRALAYMLFYSCEKS